MAHIFVDSLNFALHISPGAELWYGDNLVECLSRANDYKINTSLIRNAHEAAREQIRPTTSSVERRPFRIILTVDGWVLQRPAKDDWNSFKWFLRGHQALDHVWMRLARKRVLEGQDLPDALIIGREQALAIAENAVSEGALWSDFGLGGQNGGINTLLETTRRSLIAA